MSRSNPDSSPPTALIVLLVVAAAVVVVCGGGFVAFRWMWADMARRDELARAEIAERAAAAARLEQQAKPPERGPKTVAEWGELLVGKSPDQVRAVMGSPTDADPPAAGVPSWMYRVKVTDGAGRVEEVEITVGFARGVVERVTR